MSWIDVEETWGWNLTTGIYLRITSAHSPSMASLALAMMMMMMMLI